jgi:cytochrome P450
MNAATLKPVRLTGLAALRWGWRFARQPLTATRRIFESCGSFVVLARKLPFIRSKHAVIFGVPLVLTAGAAFNSELLSNTEIWRSISALPGGPRGSAARRMSVGLTRLTGDSHAHYRKLLLPPLRKASVEALAKNMARMAEAETASWPVGEPIDLWQYLRRIMQIFSVELLFGGNSEEGRVIAALAGRMMETKWNRGAVALPINLPNTAYGQVVRQAEILERRILQWAAIKCGPVDGRDLASIIVNSPDSKGNPPGDAAIVAHIASLLALSSEGSESTLTWALFLLMQHPRVAAVLLDELHSKLGRTSPSLDKAGDLPYLDAVVKEAMRVLPPLPILIRIAERDTEIARYEVPEGTRAVLNVFIVNRTPDLYPEGDVFRPERWSAIAPSAYEFPIFSAGPHICPGYWFAMTAVKIALAAILLRYRVSLPPGARIDYRIQPTMRPAGPMTVTLHRQDGAFAAAPIHGSIHELVRL